MSDFYIYKKKRQVAFKLDFKCSEEHISSTKIFFFIAFSGKTFLFIKNVPFLSLQTCAIPKKCQYFVQ